MKKVLILVFAIALIFSMTGIAFAAGYNDPSTANPAWDDDGSQTDPDADGDARYIYGSAQNPHGGYADTTNKCKTCHAVHLAEGPFRLLRGATGAADECEYCHGATGAHSTVSFDPSGADGHTMGWEDGRAPDDSDSSPQLIFNASNPFRCGACHSPHDNNTVVLDGESSSHLLKADPDPNEDLYWTGSGDMSKWCSDCHSANYGLHTDAKTYDGNSRYGHDCETSSVFDYHQSLSPAQVPTYPCTNCHNDTAVLADIAAPEDGTNRGPTCVMCHQSSGFPHTQGGSTSRALLKDSMGSGSPATQLDDVCNDCHWTPVLP